MAELLPITEHVLTEHAREEMTRRQITEADIAKVLASPGQTELVRNESHL